MQVGATGSWHRLPAAGQSCVGGRGQGHEAGRRPNGFSGAVPALRSSGQLKAA